MRRANMTLHKMRSTKGSGKKKKIIDTEKMMRRANMTLHKKEINTNGAMNDRKYSNWFFVPVKGALKKSRRYLYFKTFGRLTLESSFLAKTWIMWKPEACMVSRNSSKYLFPRYMHYHIE